MCKVRFQWLSAFVLTIVLGGCMKAKAPSPTPQADAGPAASEADATPRETIGKTTQNVLSLTEALADGAVLAETSVPVTDPLSQSAAAYRTTVGKLGAMAVKQAIDIRNAQSIQDPKPLTHAQFLAEIIRPGQPDGIALAMLPYYQEYAWDEAGQSLVVVDFPSRMEAREKQRESN